VTIFIVEDDSAVADALSALVADEGVSVRVFPTAESFMAAGPPGSGDVVVVDLGLPGMTGRETLRWLRRLGDPPRTVVISGKSEREIQRETEGLGISGILRKPPSLDWLLAIRAGVV